MIDWIWNNKEWIFSGIGVAVILGVASFSARFIRRRSTQAQLPTGVVLQTVIDSSPAGPGFDSPATSSIAPDSVLNAVTSAPLLQQPDIAKHYCGVRVDWTGTLISARKRKEGEVSLLIRCGSGSSAPAVSFDINPNDYPGLGLLQREDPIRVSGIIDGIQYEIIDLKDVRLVTYRRDPRF